MKKRDLKSQKLRERKCADLPCVNGYVEVNATGAYCRCLSGWRGAACDLGMSLLFLYSFHFYVNDSELTSLHHTNCVHLKSVLEVNTTHVRTTVSVQKMPHVNVSQAIRVSLVRMVR
jgi:hypothetical protein